MKKAETGEMPSKLAKAALPESGQLFNKAPFGRLSLKSKGYQNSRDYHNELNANNKGIIDYSLVESMYYLRINKKKLKYKNGWILFKLKRYEEVIGELKGIRCIEAYRLISNTYEKLDKPTKAIRYLWKIYEQDPNIEILFEISQIYFKNKVTSLFHSHS